MSKKYEIENRTRSTIVLRAFVEATNARGKKKLVADHERDIVIGDRANTPELMEAHRVPYSRKVPPPVVVVNEEQLSGLHPSQRSFYDSLVAEGSLRVQEYTG